MQLNLPEVTPPALQEVADRNSQICSRTRDVSGTQCITRVLASQGVLETHGNSADVDVVVLHVSLVHVNFVDDKSRALQKGDCEKRSPI